MVRLAKVMLFFAAMGLASQVRANPDCKVNGPPFIDPYITDLTNPVCVNFGTDVPPIPADFFGPGSDPFSGQVCLVGLPLGPTPFGDFGNADTLIQRNVDPFDRCDLPNPMPVTVPIEIVALNLVSSDPITVTFNGGQNPQPWDVMMALSDLVPSPPGQLNVTRDSCNGGGTPNRRMRSKIAANNSRGTATSAI